MSLRLLAQATGKMELLITKMGKTVAGANWQVEDQGVCFGVWYLSCLSDTKAGMPKRQWESPKFPSVSLTTRSGKRAGEWRKTTPSPILVQLADWECLCTIPITPANLHFSSTIWKFGQGLQIWVWHVLEISLKCLARWTGEFGLNFITWRLEILYYWHNIIFF